MKNRSKLKRISTVEVRLCSQYNISCSSTQMSLTVKQDVAEQVLCFAKSKSITGQNIVIDCGLSV